MEIDASPNVRDPAFAGTVARPGRCDFKFYDFFFRNILFSPL